MIKKTKVKMSHSHHHHHEHIAHSTKELKIAFFLNFTFTIIEIIGGILTNSVAILSDALHDLGDSLSLGLSWYFQKLSNKKRDKKFTFGYRRFSVFGAFINALVLVIGSFFILIEAIPRILNPQQPDAKGMLYLAILGIFVNGLAVFRLKRGSTLNEKVVSLHLLEDVLGWIAVLVVSIVIMFYNAPVLDPLLSVIIALFILFNVYKNLRSALKIMMQGTPADIKVGDIEHQIKSIDGVEDVHDIHLWTMDGDYNVLTVHIVTKGVKSLAELAEIKNHIRQKLDTDRINHVTIEFETPEEECLHMDC